RLLHQENEQIASSQFEYLERRQQELLRKWDGSLDDHVAYLKSNLGEGGYLSVSQELEYLQAPKIAYTSRLLETECDLKRLQSQNWDKRKKKKEDLLLPILFSEKEDPSYDLLLEEEKRGIEKSLGNLAEEEARLSFKPGIEGEISQLTEETKTALEMLKRLENAQELPPLIHTPGSLVAIWGKQIAALEGKAEEPLLCAYKDKLRLLAEENGEKIQKLQANIAIRNTESEEFAGLTLETARRLYVDYNNQRDGLQAHLKQLIYLSEQLYQPQFELSSITTILTDSVTQGLVIQAGETSVSLQDLNNRSLREQQHLKEKLHTQKTFIAQHLLQIIELTKLRLQLSEDKIASLRMTTIDLLEQEKHLLQNQLDKIQSQMGQVPEKWHREHLLLFKKELGSKMIEGLTQLMESKSLDRYLYHVRSKPLDFSFPPLKASYPYLFFSMVFGGLGFGFLGYLFYFIRSIFTGFPLSHAMLKSLGLNSCGILSPHCQSPLRHLFLNDLETLRNLIPSLSDVKICAILGGNTPDFSSQLAELLAMHQRRVLVIRYVFDEKISPENLPGLWQYIHGETVVCPIRKKPFADFLVSGSTSCYAVELLSHPKMASFLEEIKSSYDLILFYSKAAVTAAEAKALMQISDAAIITTGQQTKEEILICQEWKEKKISFTASF
ncbi:MAG: hypothetical protein HYZ48_04145, partial [Chlamydiales bacterium]|nr:hypothetical protein [Chlamydiales bacterium]